MVGTGEEPNELEDREGSDFLLPQDNAGDSESVRCVARAEGTGVEPATGKPATDFESAENVKKRRENKGLLNAANNVQTTVSEIDEIAAKWETLPEHVRLAIMGLVRGW